MFVYYWTLWHTKFAILGAITYHIQRKHTFNPIFHKGMGNPIWFFCIYLQLFYKTLQVSVILTKIGNKTERRFKCNLLEVASSEITKMADCFHLGYFCCTSFFTSFLLYRNKKSGTFFWRKSIFLSLKILPVFTCFNLP